MKHSAASGGVAGSGGGGGGVASGRRRARKSSRPARRLTRRAVVKMLAVMERTPDSNHDPVQDFLSTGRTGRRNAMPDILGEHANTSTAELPARLQRLNTTTHGHADDGAEASTSGTAPGGGASPGDGGAGGGSEGAAAGTSGAETAAVGQSSGGSS